MGKEIENQCLVMLKLKNINFRAIKIHFFRKCRY